MEKSYAHQWVCKKKVVCKTKNKMPDLLFMTFCQIMVKFPHILSVYHIIDDQLWQSEIGFLITSNLVLFTKPNITENIQNLMEIFLLLSFAHPPWSFSTFDGTWNYNPDMNIYSNLAMLSRVKLIISVLNLTLFLTHPS